MAQSKETMAGIKAALISVKEMAEWDIKVKTGSSKEAPLPITIRRKISRPAHSSEWDQMELAILLSIDDVDGGLKVHVEIPQKGIPEALRSKIASAVTTQWQKELAAGKGKGPGGVDDWRLREVFNWAEKGYGSLLGLVPQLLEMYEGCDEMGAGNFVTQRRYTIMQELPKAAEADEDAEVEQKEPDLDPAEAARRQLIIDEKRRKKAEAEEAARLAKIAEADRKRCLAEKGVYEDGQKAALKSKKELEEAHKSKQGIRMSKTAERHTKYAGEGSKLEKEGKGIKKK